LFVAGFAGGTITPERIPFPTVTRALEITSEASLPFRVFHCQDAVKQ
jgi:hypothetical protein